MSTKIKEKTLKKLKSAVGTSNLSVDKKELSEYSTDESPGLEFMPEVVVFPESEEHVREITKLAYMEKIPLTARGAGTALTGASLPYRGGIVISFKKMNRILDIDTTSRMARVEPGVITGELDREASKHNLFYPVNPASLDSCTLGGNAATSAGGANTVRYGTTRHYLSGIRAVDGRGHLWSAGGNVVKNSTDLQLVQLAAGSEGTLSIFTELNFRLKPRPKETAWIIAPFKDIKMVPSGAEKIFSLSFNPTMLELMDSTTLSCCAGYINEDIPFSKYNQMLVSFDFGPRSNSEDILIEAGKACMEAGAEDVIIADTNRAKEKIWKIRSSIHDAIDHTTGSICEEDVVVPLSKIKELLEAAGKIASGQEVKVALYGHLGDGNIHVNFLGKPSNKVKADSLREELFKAVAKLSGKVSGEHGIGITKKSCFGKYVDKNYIKLLKKIKKEFDPEGILNPGKIF
ncbi:MAG: FAD-binding oxidoreductase [Elusimicrobiota bacterium]